MAKIVFDLDRRDVSAPDFAEGFLAQMRLVEQVMVEMGIVAGQVRWVIEELHAGSAYAAATAHIQGDKVAMADIEAAIRIAGQGTKDLASSSKRPPLFSDAALKTSRTLTRILSEYDSGKAVARFGQIVVKPNEKVAENVATIIRGDLRSIASVDGMLVGVNDYGSIEIAVVDRLRNRRIRCQIPDALLETALGAFKKRVMVRGLMWSRHDGTAIRIDVRSLEVMPPDDQLPTHDKVRGILNGFRLANGE
jgi:hypothetical protein